MLIIKPLTNEELSLKLILVIYLYSNFEQLLFIFHQHLTGRKKLDFPTSHHINVYISFITRRLNEPKI